jgi:drug/metabolite transporter (DMT)-like permease
MNASTAETTARRRTLLGYACALTAAMSYGAGNVLTRHSVTEVGEPLVGTTLALFWGTLGFSLLLLRGGRERPVDFRRGALHFAVAGFFSTIGVASLFFALERAAVVVVVPVSSTNPLFTLLFAAVLLRDVERLTLRLVAGALLVVAGVIVLSLA